MNTKPEITNTVRRAIAATLPETLKRAADECDNYTFQKAGAGYYACIHGDNTYMISDIDGEVGCSCGDMTHRCKDNEVCKHLATYLKRSRAPTAKLDREIAKDLMSAGWTGGEGELCPPHTTSDPDGEDEDGEGSDPIPDQPPASPEIPKPGMMSATCPHCGDTIEGTTGPELSHAIAEHDKTCQKRPETSEPEHEPTEATFVASRDCEHQDRAGDQDEPDPKKYTHPDGTEFITAEGLLSYAEKCKASQNMFDTRATRTFQLAPMIKGLRPPLRERGRITIGKKGATNASGRGRKSIKFDHFVFTTMDKDEKTDDYILDTEMNERYGKDCREIPVRFLSDDITEIFHTEYAKYAASGPKLRGDGENWIVYKSDGTRTYIRDPGHEHRFLDDPDVKPHGILTVLVDGQNSVGSVYRYRTTGWNSINGMLASLALCSGIAQRAGGRIAFLPMMLVYNFKWTTPKGQATKKKIPVVTCEFRGDVEELQAQSRAAMQYLTSPAAAQVEQLASANAYDAEEITLEEAKDIGAEFHPGVE